MMIPQINNHTWFILLYCHGIQWKKIPCFHYRLNKWLILSPITLLLWGGKVVLVWLPLWSHLSLGQIQTIASMHLPFFILYTSGNFISYSINLSKILYLHVHARLAIGHFQNLWITNLAILPRHIVQLWSILVFKCLFHMLTTTI